MSFVLLSVMILKLEIFSFLKRERGTGCEGEVNKDESVCLFVFNGSYVSVSSPVVLCEQGWS